MAADASTLAVTGNEPIYNRAFAVFRATPEAGGIAFPSRNGGQARATIQ